MEKVEKQFGKVTVRKVSTISNPVLGSSDLFFARLKNRKLGEQCVLVLAPHDPNAPNINAISQLPWTSLHVRNYANSNLMYEALEGKVSAENISATDKISLDKVKWSKNTDTDLKAEKILEDKNIYTSSELPGMKVVLFSSYKDNKHGNELEGEIGLIPAMNTLNFAIIKE